MTTDFLNAFIAFIPNLFKELLWNRWPKWGVPKDINPFMWYLWDYMNIKADLAIKPPKECVINEIE